MRHVEIEIQVCVLRVLRYYNVSIVSFCCFLIIISVYQAYVRNVVHVVEKLFWKIGS